MPITTYKIQEKPDKWETKNVDKSKEAITTKTVNHINKSWK